MARAAVFGDALRIGGYALAGAVLCPASDQAEAVRGWRSLPADIAVVVLTAQASDWLAAELSSRPEVLSVVLADAAPS